MNFTNAQFIIPQTPARTATVPIFAKKKYKPVARKVRPVLTETPERFRIVRDIKGDPLATLPILNTRPPLFAPSGRYTEECREIIDKFHLPGFLWDEERALLHHFMVVHQDSFA